MFVATVLLRTWAHNVNKTAKCRRFCQLLCARKHTGVKRNIRRLSQTFFLPDLRPRPPPLRGGVRSGPDYQLGRLYHGRGPHRKGAPADQLPNLPRCFDVWRFSVCLNVTTTEKGRQLFGEKKFTATDKKILASRTRKGPRLTLVWGLPNG